MAKKNRGARGKNSNTFRQGLNTDMHPLDTSKEVMTDNANATLITSEGDEYILQNMSGNELTTSLTEGFKPIAVKVFNNVAYIVSQNIVDPTIGEIGTFPSPKWDELNKQIATLKELLIGNLISDEIIESTVELTPYLNTSKLSRRVFTGTWKTAEELFATPGEEGCKVCVWGLKLTAGSNDGYRGPWAPGANFTVAATCTGQTLCLPSIDTQMKVRAHVTDEGPIIPPSTYPSSCYCGNLTYNWPNATPPASNWITTSNGTTVNNQTDTITYTFTVAQDGVAYCTIDFTGTFIQGTIQASTAEGIGNATQYHVASDSPPVNGMVIDSSTTTVKFVTIGPLPPWGGTNATFQIISNVEHISFHTVNPITGWRFGPDSREMVRRYDIAALGLSGTQLSQAVFSLYHAPNYPNSDIVTEEIKFKVSSNPTGMGPTVYQDIYSDPGTEVPLPITGAAGISTPGQYMDLYILYPGNGFGGDFPQNYQVFMTYPSEEGEVCVPMEDNYKPLHNFYDYNAEYWDPVATPTPPANPPTDESLDNEAYYVAPLRTSSFNFSAVNFLDMELQPAYDRSVNIIYTDNVNKPKLFNSRFIVKAGNKEATIADRQGVRDTNVYSNERWGNTDLILTADTVARLRFIGFDDGGNLQPGGYRFYFVYSNSDLQTSTVFAESRLVQVTKSNGLTIQGGKPDDRIGKTIHFELEDLDNKFLFVKIFYARDMGEFNAGSYELKEVFNLYPITTEGTLDIRFTGFELTIERASNYLETIFSDISTAKTLTAIQGSLAVANATVSLEHLDYLRLLSSNIRIQEATESMADLDAKNTGKNRIEKRAPYMDAENVYHSLGMWSGETYELGVVYKMKGSNLLSPVIPIRGLDNFNGGEVYTGSGVTPAPGFDDSDLKRENTNGVYRTKESKIIMDGDSARPDNPNITYLTVNMNVIVNDVGMREFTSGFFIVRKQRLKDCQYEGMLGGAMSVPLSEPITQIATLRSYGITGGLGSMDNAGGNFNVATRNDHGPELRNEWPARYLPWMGSVGNYAVPGWDSTTGDPDYNPGQLMFTNNPYEGSQANPNPNDVWSHFSFYTPEITTDPLDVAAFFSGTARGLRYAANKVYMNSGNGSAFGSFRTLKPALFQSQYIDKGTPGNPLYRPGVLSTAGMTDYTLNSLRWNYITAGQDTVTPESFSALMRGYEYMANQTSAPTNNKLGWQYAIASDSANGQGINESTGPNDAGRINHRFDDFVGLIVNDGDNTVLREIVQHDTTLAGSLTADSPADDYAINRDDFYDAMEDNRVAMGALCRAYATSAGPLNRGNQWQAKYQSTTTTGYFAISDRYSWESFETELPSGELKLFDGDCYVGEHYKRLHYKLGIQDNPAATDGSIYKDEAAALEPAGIIMAMVLHSSQNFSIRTEEFKSASELTVYGTDRSFYPVYPVNEIRNKQQIDSKLFYAGYGLEAAALTKARQAIELPAILQTYPYRVLLSAPADLTSFTNGYRDFTGLNFRDYDSAFGQITKVVAIQSQLYVIWEYGIGRVFTAEKTIVTNEDGGVYVDQASRLHPQAQVLSNKYGSTDPYSIIVTADSIYGIDWSNNKVWRVTAVGQFELISDFKIEKLLSKVKDDLEGNNVVHKFYAGYDTYKRNVYFNYSGYNNGIPIPIGSIYFNETLQIWMSRLTFYPYFIFNIRENWYSYNFDDLDPITAGQIWQHNSKNVPFCNFYGVQHPFEYEFILVDNPAAQKILNNLKIVSTEEYPITATYSIVNKHDYETGHIREVSFVERLLKRYKQVTATMLSALAGASYLVFETDPNIIAGDKIQIDHGGTLYEVQDVYFYLNQYYVYVVHADPISGEIVGGTSQAYAGGNHVTINNGIIRENILYKEDHFYIVVGNRFAFVTESGFAGTSLDSLPSVPIGEVDVPITPEAPSPNLIPQSVLGLPTLNNLGIDPRTSIDAVQLSGFGIRFPGLTGVDISRTMMGDEITTFAGPSGPSDSTFYSPGTPDRIVAQAQLSAPRDKYIRIKLRYTGDRQVFIQSVETLFTYSFS